LPFFAIFNFEQSHESSLHKQSAQVTDPAKVRVPAYLPDTSTVRADIAHYFDNVSRADAALGKILAELAADGLAEDTIIFYYGDHGGAVSRSKRFLYENGTHPPLVAHFPKKFQHLAPAAPNSRLSELVNFIDLAPTVLSLAGLPLPAQFQGRAIAGPARKAGPEFTFSFRDRMDERYDMARAVTDGRFRYIRNYYPSQPWGQHLEYLWRQPSMKEWAGLFAAGKLNAAQRAFFENKPTEELFDCVADPDNVRNLAADPTALVFRNYSTSAPVAPFPLAPGAWDAPTGGAWPPTPAWWVGGGAGAGGGTSELSVQVVTEGPCPCPELSVWQPLAEGGGPVRTA
jgi:arylsulfatase A-like enzyme